MITLIIFFISYIGFVISPRYKAWIALIASLILILLNAVTPMEALSEIHWNVIGLFLGTLILAELFLHSKVPAVLAEWIVDHASSVRMALIGVFALASIISMFVENVAVVLLIAPVIVTLCEKLKISPIKPLMLLAMFSNLQGTATLIGDPPSMILGSYMKMSFQDFFFYLGKPGIFFVVQIGAISTLLFAFWLFRNYSQSVKLIKVEKVKSWIPSVLLVLLIIILALGSNFDKNSTWLAGVTAITLAVVGLIWHHFGPNWKPTWQIISTLDWETTFFLAALFILIGAIRIAGWMNFLSDWIVTHLPVDLLTLYIVLIVISILISAFVDNVPYLIAMIPVVQDIADSTGFSLPLLVFGLLIGTCLGGNITPIGASANIVAVSFLEKNGHQTSFSSFVKIGLLFTFFAVIPASIFLWKIWS